MSGKEILYHSLTVFLGIGSLLLGLFTDFFGLVGDDPMAANLASFSLALLFVLLGERIAMGERIGQTGAEFSSNVDELRRSLPELTTVLRFTTCDDALEDVARHLPTAKRCLNTAISRDGVRSGEKAWGLYNKARQQAIRNGIKISDVVSPQLKDAADDLKRFAQGKAGEYEFLELDTNVSCFLNFIVLEYEDGTKDLWLGWATSNSFNVQQPAFRLRDDRVATYFSEYHQALRT